MTDALPPGIEATEWDLYRKKTATWAVKLPKPVTVRTAEGVVEADAFDYLAIDNRGELYPIDADEFEHAYRPIESDLPEPPSFGTAAALLREEDDDG